MRLSSTDVLEPSSIFRDALWRNLERWAGFAENEEGWGWRSVARRLKRKVFPTSLTMNSHVGTTSLSRDMHLTQIFERLPQFFLYVGID
jgi:hypothetical protein